MAEETVRAEEEGPPNPASQIGRARQTGGTPEGRRQADKDVGTDGERWRAPVEEDDPIEASRDREP